MGEQRAAAALIANAVPATSSNRLAALFEAHGDRLYRLARRLSPARDDARDLVQETFLRAASALESVPDGHRDAEAWLLRVLVNVQRDQWRKATTRKRLHPLVTVSDVDRSDSEFTLIARTDVWRAVNLLSPRRRAIVILHELEGLPVSEIASLLGIAAITVRWHLSRGRRDLAHMLNPKIGSET
jgi:RNA polymerase sigma-70 factor (ECF subfamily)